MLLHAVHTFCWWAAHAGMHGMCCTKRCAERSRLPVEVGDLREADLEPAVRRQCKAASPRSAGCRAGSGPRTLSRTSASSMLSLLGSGLDRRGGAGAGSASRPARAMKPPYHHTPWRAQQGTMRVSHLLWQRVCKGCTLGTSAYRNKKRSCKVMIKVRLIG